MKGHNKRIRLLDILRGFAVLGTLGTNIWIFAHLGDLSYVFTYDHYVWWESFEDFIRIFVLFLVNGKFLGLLTIMFGVGLELKYQQSLRRGSAWPGIYIWISVILIVEGFIHFMLVMEYDILMSYGVTAIIVSFIIKGGDRIIARTMKIIGGLHAGFILLILIQGILFNISGAQISIGDMKEVAILYKDGTWIEQVQYRLMNFFALRTEVIFLIPLNIFLFLLGVRLMRAGVFSPDENGKRQREKLFKLGLYIGIPLNLLIFVPGGIFDFPVRYLFAPLLSLGYLAIIAKIVERNKEFWLWNKLENVGKMSLSCYVLQNIASVIIFYGWGFGFGNKVDSITIIIIWFVLSSFQIIFANFWLQHVKFGPMEAARRYILRLITK
ncbi:DUF418 domain-containing protein [Metabacillus fastidiosus]|uniref:DUF418 domain-containing protein n=1 Tax=Metabacillus fastidiosus TaxID=1458 RepID=A0ABU6P2R1_9BACI|nr:DUF418 domain-containing protein [Metabacillus fastidiosus]MED4403203.1 DUF418 domain-containing protein [Metabacillus fastidiosus]MED4461627.1 DUF418 domain-containing protein [Metabacillus fastidiosus]